MKIKGQIILVVLFLTFSFGFISNTLAASTGFIPANIWYSKEPLEDGDRVKIYTLIFNSDGRELSATVFFFDKTTLMGQKNITVPAKGVKDVSVDWTVTAGDHTISAKIENAKFLISKGKYEEVRLTENESEQSKVTVNKKIIPQKSIDVETIPVALPQIETIKNTVLEKTPDIVSRPIIATTTMLENTRVVWDDKSEEKKAEIRIALDNLKEGKETSARVPQKPWKYIQLFFLALFGFIVGQSIIFYGVIVLVIFFVVRYLFRLVF